MSEEKFSARANANILEIIYKITAEYINLAI